MEIPVPSGHLITHLMKLLAPTVIAIQLKRLVAVLSCITLVFPVLFCQKKWTGGFSERWDNPLNWQPEGVPAASDVVILDNSLLTRDYKVFLPDQLTAIHSLLIEPGRASRIELTLPASNITSPALQVLEPGNSIMIRKGGIFRNSSGLNSGQSLMVNGMLCIYDDGAYIHNSRSAHAADIVAKLSTASGTEKGLFEYDVPGGSYPISLSNRSYGTLMLSSTASGGTQTYNASGTNQVTINGDLKINNGVQFNLDLTRDMIVNGNYIQPGGVFNIASQNNNNVVIIRGDITQGGSGLITETAAGLPVVELSGNSQQLVLFAGRFENSVTLRVNNSNGIALLSQLSLSFKLQLLRGKVKSSPSAFITLLDNCTISGGSVDSFIDGPLRKIGDDDFEFPVGKESDYAPVKISGIGGNVTDEFTAAYFLSNPATVYGASFENPPVVRISTLEYWTLEQSSGSSPRKVSLSVGTYSQATALEYLVVVRWNKQASSWRNAGNSSYSGLTTGTITSNELNEFGTFTLGSSIATQNPLPLKLLNFRANSGAGAVDFRWKALKNTDQLQYEIEKSRDGKLYQHVAVIHVNQGSEEYHFRYSGVEGNDVFFRLKIIMKNREIFYSEPFKIPVGSFRSLKLYPLLARSELTLEMHKNFYGNLSISISDYTGKILRQFARHCKQGENIIKLDVGGLAGGTYILQVKESNGMYKGYTFFKR